MALAGGATTVPAAASKAAAIATFTGFMSVPPSTLAYWLPIKPPARRPGRHFSR